MIYQDIFDERIVEDLANDFIDGMMGIASFIDDEIGKLDLGGSGDNKKKTAPNPSANPINTQILTDVREYEDKYEFDLELPGYEKTEIKIDLKKGYLSVEAEHVEAKPEAEVELKEVEDIVEDKEEVSEEAEKAAEPAEKYIKRERYLGLKKRSFYVGNAVTKKDISAKFENGVLKIFVPKVKPIEEEKSYIEIDD